MAAATRFPGLVSGEDRAVDDKAEMEAQEFGRLFHHDHPIQKDLEIFDHLREARIDGQFQTDNLARRVDKHLALGRGIVDAIVDVEILEGVGLNAAAVDVGFVGDIERGRDRRRGVAPLLFVVADSVGDDGSLVRRHPQARKHAQGDEAAALRVAFAVDYVADVVEIAGDGRQFGNAFGVIGFEQDGAGGFGDAGGMAGAVFGVAQNAQVSIRVVNENANFLISTHLFQSNHANSPSQSSIATAQLGSGILICQARLICWGNYCKWLAIWQQTTGPCLEKVVQRVVISWQSQCCRGQGWLWSD